MGPGKRWWAGQLAGWLLTAVVLTYATWFFGFATVHDGPLGAVPVRAMASDRQFSDVQEMVGILAQVPEQAVVKTGIHKPTTWIFATIPRGLRFQGRTIHLTEKSIARGEAVVLNARGQAVLWSMFGVGITPLEAWRALPGFALEIPSDWNDREDLTLVVRVEPAGVTNSLALDLWYTKRFQDAQFKLQQRTAMLIGALMLLTAYALAAAQAGKVPYLLVFAFWLVARCGFVMSTDGFSFFSFGVHAGSPIGLGLRQVALLSFPFASALLLWSLTQAELQGTFVRRLLLAVLVASCGATLVVGVLPSPVFQILLWLSAGIVIATVLTVIVAGFRRINNTTTRWYFGGLLVDVAAGLNQLIQSMGYATPLPQLSLQPAGPFLGDHRTHGDTGQHRRQQRDRLQAQEAVIEVLGRYESVYRTVPIGLVSFGPDDQAERFNDGFARMFGLPSPLDGARGVAQPGSPQTGLPAAAAVDMQAVNRVFPVALRNRIRAELANDGECDFPYRIGDELQGRWLRILASGTHASFEASVTDITEHKNTERRLAHAAEHDALTGALNRRGLVRRITRLLDQDTGDGIGKASLLYLDLDRFKLLNDLFGHPAGDVVLQDVVGRLQAALGDKTAVARLGGDEFAALLDADSSADHEQLAQHALQAIAGEPFRIPPRSFSVTASVGLFRFAAALSPEALIAGADRACLDAKRKGRNQVVIQNDASALIKRQMAELAVLADLGDTDTFGEFELTIQPIVSLHDSRRMGGEVLLRHRAVDGSLQPADHLTEAAAERGEMCNVDRWMLRQSLHWLSRHGERFGLLDFLSLNVSATSLNDEFFKTFVRALLRKHHHIAHLVVVEIDEGVAMQDVFVMEKFIAQLRETGARLALDDFGSSASSFASLGDVGASYLKIDGRFVRSLSEQASSTTVIRTINVLSHELGMECIADSIDDASTLALVRKLGADYGQGSALCPPLPLADFEALCAAGRIEHPPEIHRALGDSAGVSARPRATLPVPVV